MNSTLYSLSLTSIHVSSPYFLIRHSMIMKRCEFRNGFETILKTDSRSFLDDCRFRRLLNRAVLVENDVINSLFNTRQEFTISTADVVFRNCVFSDCQSSKRGGAVCVSQNTICASFRECGFFNCYSSLSRSYSAGGLAVYSSFSVIVTKSCFNKCSDLNDPPAYQIAPHGGGVKETTLTFNSESFNGDRTKTSTFGSMSGGLSYFLFSNNNITHTVSNNERMGGIVFVKTTETTEIGSYCSVANCEGKGFVSFFVMDSKTRKLSSFNFINNTITKDFWIAHESSSTRPLFDGCVFLFNTNCITSNSGGIPIFLNCYFSGTYISSSHKGSLTNPLFSANNNNQIRIEFYSTYYCWARGSPIPTPSQKMIITMKFINDSSVRLVLLNCISFMFLVLTLI